MVQMDRTLQRPRRRSEYPTPIRLSIFFHARFVASRLILLLLLLPLPTAKKEMKQTREGWGEGWVGRRGWTGREEEVEGGGSAIGNPLGPNDQCHGAFIVLQQKGAHQSTGISSRLISRSRPPPSPGPLSPYHPRTAATAAPLQPGGDSSPRFLSLSAPEVPP